MRKMLSLCRHIVCSLVEKCVVYCLKWDPACLVGFCGWFQRLEIRIFIGLIQAKRDNARGGHNASCGVMQTTNIQ